LSGGLGAPDFRAFLMISYASGASEIPRLGPPPKPIDRGDDDGDGVINEYDKCPNELEDIDVYEDDDGCPEPDNDADGLLDSVDQCPDRPEDKDGFQDDDGCPDEDNDGDGIADSRDECPDEPEDKDGNRDLDGCDDPDDDGDGIPDAIDKCPGEAETINGNKDDDGCPDSGDTLVMMAPDRIETFAPVKFRGRTNQILRGSSNVLGQVAATLRASRDILRVRIAVHVHPRNADDKRLSEQRAEAVKAWLIKWGVEPERLEARGYGSSQPLVKRNKRGAAEINDRVEFVILEKKVRRKR
jgi:outer membrane protein OmpA-like peptidoglycan-associated protein